MKKEPPTTMQSPVAYHLLAEDARLVGEWLANHMAQGDESSHRVAAALLSLANGDGAIVLDEGEDF